MNKLGSACTAIGLTNTPWIWFFVSLCCVSTGAWCSSLVAQRICGSEVPWAFTAPQKSFVKPFCKPSIVSTEESRKAQSTKSSSILFIFFTLVRPLQCCGVFEKCKIATNNSGVFSKMMFVTYKNESGIWMDLTSYFYDVIYNPRLTKTALKQPFGRYLWTISYNLGNKTISSISKRAGVWLFLRNSELWWLGFIFLFFPQSLNISFVLWW